MNIRKTGAPNAYTAFVAYPDNETVKDTIAGAVGLSSNEKLALIPWERMDVYGLKIDNLVRSSIDECSVFIADISINNFNVYYEIGYAIAKQKAVLPIVNSALQDAKHNVQSTGIFDNIGWLEYENSDDLSIKLRQWQRKSWVENFTREKNHSQPLFVLDMVKKTNFRQDIFQAVANRSVEKRTFDPSEIVRLSAPKAIVEISSSAGCILPLLTKNIVDFELNNLRAAFLAGLAHGFEIEPLLLQFGNGPAPLDYRDYITNSTSSKETHDHVEDYCSSVLIRNQESSGRESQFKLGTLSDVHLGSSAAENESFYLSNYFVETAQYLTVIRAQNAVVTGRKGSGKTAVLLQAREHFLRKKQNLVLDIRPATHNLSELRHELVQVTNEGVFDHTIAGFWNYIVYMEILLAIREKALLKAKRDFDLQKRIIKIEEDFDLKEKYVSGDFTARLEYAIGDLVRFVKSKPTINVKDISGFTNIIYDESIPKLREAILTFKDFFEDIVLLFDDLDKGWPPQQLENHDVLMVKHLIEILRKTSRELNKNDVEFRFYLFLRSDVYEKLVEETSDRQKYNIVNVDWSEQSQLEYLLKQRVVSNFDENDKKEAWESVNPVLADGHFAVEHLIRGSLYRPRFLIELCEKVISSAINRGSMCVDGKDVENGLLQMARYLVSDFAFEIRDISGLHQDLLYRFIGKPQLLTAKEISDLVDGLHDHLDTKQIIELLLWYGFLGVAKGDQNSLYIFDCGYDFRRLKAELPAKMDDALYSVNPAFLKGL